MESNNGSQEPLSDWGPQKRARLERLRTVNRSPSLTREEQDRIADGEPYCFRCGKPAGSFEEYKIGAEHEGLATAWQYVIEEEGTYNDDTNRFACDECYIAIGAPFTNTIEGWKAP